jgi:hypothetical protein
LRLIFPAVQGGDGAAAIEKVAVLRSLAKIEIAASVFQKTGYATKAKSRSRFRLIQAHVWDVRSKTVVYVKHCPESLFAAKMILDNTIRCGWRR